MRDEYNWFRIVSSSRLWYYGIQKWKEEEELLCAFMHSLLLLFVIPIENDADLVNKNCHDKMH
jgi:hypothetical protein